MEKQTVLVTGGAGFIGSHCCVDLLQDGFNVVVVDSLVNSSSASLESVRRLGGGDLRLYVLDVRDTDALSQVVTAQPIDTVVHFAAYKAVGDSVKRPLQYYANNVNGLLSLLQVMQESGLKHLIFSSSCSIYGNTTDLPITEDHPARPVNPYAQSKWMCEQILTDLCNRYKDWSVTALRYFNPAGAHKTGELGEDPIGLPSNIFPLLMQVAAGRRERVEVFGSDYPTRDGTAVRDYIHVMDVVEGHRVALKAGESSGFHRYNLGTGAGTTVLELIQKFSAISGRAIPYTFSERRPGDVPELVASPELAETEFGWTAKRTLSDMCRDAWNFQQKYPMGYRKVAERIG